MKFLPEALDQYVTDHTSQEPEVLQELNRETQQKIMKPQMLSGHVQGTFLRMMSNMIRPQTIVEVGTYTGYSAICLADGLVEGGVLHTIDNNEELEDMARHYFQKAGLSDVIHLHIGDASETIPSLAGPFDLVFIDADKVNYSTYYDLVIERMRPNGIILADNTLWSGKVVDEEQDEDTRALVAFNDKVQADNRVENVLLSIRDGVMMMRKVDE